MAYIGNQPTSVAFLTDYFSGNGTTTSFTMSVAPATTTSMLVAISGVLQDPTTYGINGTTLTFSPAPPAGTGNICVRYLGIPASGVVTTAYRTVTEFTATAGQTTFTPPSYSVGFINVFRNGVRLGAANFTATNGTTVVLTNAASVGDIIVIESFQVSSFNNALPQTGGTINAPANATPLIVQSNGSTGLIVNSSLNVGIGTTSPQAITHLERNVVGEVSLFVNNPNASGYTGVRLGNNDRATNGDHLIYGSSSLGIRSKTGTPITFEPGGTERLRINNLGNLSKPNPVGQAFRSQWLNSSKSYGTTSGAWIPLFFCDHTHSLTYNFLAIHPNGVNNGGGSVCGFSSIVYGGGNGPTNTQSGVLGGGYVTSLSARYNNAGYQIEIQVNGTFGGAAPIIYWQVIGTSLDQFGAL